MTLGTGRENYLSRQSRENYRKMIEAITKQRFLFVLVSGQISSDFLLSDNFCLSFSRYIAPYDSFLYHQGGNPNTKHTLLLLYSREADLTTGSYTCGGFDTQQKNKAEKRRTAEKRAAGGFSLVFKSISKTNRCSYSPS